MGNEKPKGKIKQIIISILVLLLGGGYVAYDQMGAGGGGDHYQVLVGSSPDTFIQFPISYVKEDSTTTPTYADSDNFVDIGTASTTGGLVNQLVNVADYTDYTVYADLRGGTATSTFCIRPQWSFDGTNYYGINSTSTENIISTSTPLVINQAICIDPGTVTTTWTFIGKIPAAKSARFLMIADNLTTDPTDGVEGHVTIGLENNSGLR